MSLISPQDRKIAVKALESFLASGDTEFNRSDIQALLNWIKLEQSKFDN
jgi:hypothetical protein